MTTKTTKQPKANQPLSRKEACTKAAKVALTKNETVQWAVRLAADLLGDDKRTRVGKSDIQYICFKLEGRYLDEVRNGERVKIV